MASEFMVVCQGGKVIGPLTEHEFVVMKPNLDLDAQYVILPKEGWVSYESFVEKWSSSNPSTQHPREQKMVWTGVLIVLAMTLGAFLIIWGWRKWQLLSGF